MATDPFLFAEILSQFVERSGYTTGQLSKLAGIPKATIVNWTEGRVKRPRGHEDLLRLLAALRLSPTEASRLLEAAGHPGLAELRLLAQNEANVELTHLLASWTTPIADTPPLPAPFQAIPDLSYFVGRATLLEHLANTLLSSQQGAVVTLYGMAGAGKTTLAAHLAYQLRPHFPDGILWARVDISDPMSILSTFANAYGVDASPYVDIDSRGRVVRELLAAKRALIVLDNVERSAQAQPLLPPTTHCVVLITTRRRNLSVARGGAQFPVGPFNEDGRESLQLFRKLLGEEPDPAVRESRRAIAAALGHLPLAVDIAASRLAYEPGWSESAFLRRLRQEQRRLQELAFEDQNVRLSLHASYDGLSAAARQFFAALGVIRGEDFGPEAAAVISATPLEDAEDLLRQLFSLSLVQQGRPGRYQLHPLVRAFAREQLSPAACLDHERRLAVYYLTFAAAHARDMQALTLEQDHLLNSVQIATAQAEEDSLPADTALLSVLPAGVAAIYSFWETHGYYDLATEQLGRTENALRRGEPAPALVPVLRGLGRLAQRRGQYDAAETYYEEGLTLARAQPPEPENGAAYEANAALISDLLRNLGVLAARRGDYALADAYYQEGLALARGVGQSNVVSNLLRGLGVQAFMRGDYARAEAFYEEGLALAQSAGELDLRSGLYWALGMLAEDQGDLGEAARYLHASLELVRQMGQRERETAILRDLGLIALEEGDLPAATTCLREAMALARALGHFSRLSGILLAQGEVLLLRDAGVEAEGMFVEVLGMAKDAGNQAMMAEALFGLARAAAIQARWPQAQAHAAASVNLFKTIGHPKAAEVIIWQQAHAIQPHQV
ncbi:MAG: tetratricopeptide repeat protein [Ardenticatenales bacterium]|nr:tetratricopeptide repeat protein [Ardenticatenales bacterium]